MTSPQGHGSYLLVGHLDAHHGDFLRNSRNANAHRTQGQGDVVLEGRHLGQADPWASSTSYRVTEGPRVTLQMRASILKLCRASFRRRVFFPHFRRAVCGAAGGGFQ